MKLHVLDTQALVWLALDNPRLGPSSRRLYEAGRAAGRVAVSALSFWEIAMLVTRNRIELQSPVAEWRREVLSTGLAELAVTGDIGITAVSLDGFHADPADRIITATALTRDAVLISSDEKILAWPGPLARHDARS